MLNQIILKGSPPARARALRTLSLNNSFFSARVATIESPQRGPFAGRFAPLAAALAGPQKERTIYSANNTQRLPGVRVRGEGDGNTGDPAVDEAYNFMGQTFDFYWNIFNRNSVDDAGLPLNGTVHYEKDYDNAFWDGQRMIYGDGDGQQFERFTKSVDVIGHELTHGVTQNEANLIYWFQPGALNESISDVFGSLVKQYMNKETAAQADWLIGQGLFTPSVTGVAIRSLKAPGTAYDDPVLGKDPQPAHMSDYVHGLSDNGGVHINSGIPNYAFYLAATAIGGYAWEKAGLIWYQTLCSPLLRRGAKFGAFAVLTLLTARQLFGVNSAEEGAVGNAWSAVGIGL
jgi:Zn-dependent metalloprotease